MTVEPLIVIVGGPDVDARISLMKALQMDFKLIALGTTPSLSQKFSRAGFVYHKYLSLRGANPLSDIYSFFSLWYLFFQLKPDLVHTFDSKPGVWGRLAARLARVPIVIGTLPGLGSLYSHNNLRTRVVRSIYQPLQKIACHISDLTIFQNYEDAEQFILDGVTPRNRTVILNGSGIQTQVFDPQRLTSEQRRRVRTSLGLDDTKVVVVMISRLIRSKGVLEFAQSAKFIQKQYPETVFLLVGADDYQSVDVLTHDERELIARSVTSLGARDNILELLAVSDIFVLPTYYREGIPRVLLEAASMGLPMVATNVPGCKEVVEQNTNGLLVPPRDVDALRNAIEALVVDPSLRKRFGTASRERAITLFDLSFIAGQTAEIYTRLLTEKVRGKQTYS